MKSERTNIQKNKIDHVFFRHTQIRKKNRDLKRAAIMELRTNLSFPISLTSRILAACSGPVPVNGTSGSVCPVEANKKFR